MTKYAQILLTLVVIQIANAQNAPIATVTFKAITDAGEPIAGAEIRLKTFLRWQPGEGFGKDIYDEHTGKTNAAGLITLSFPSSRGEIRFGGYMNGYYPTEGAIFTLKRGETGEWQPENPTVNVVIKPILNPVTVFARRPERLRIPVAAQPVGFDLMKSDWVAPYGKGEVEDFIFILSGNDKGTRAPFETTLLLRFSNEGDGIQSVIVPQQGGSKLRLPRFAPEDGYMPELLLRRSRINVDGAVASDVNESQNYFFRVRTQKQDGKIVSALYGKISGNIEFWENRAIRFAYYLNPESRSRNMEFDMQKNQIRGLRGYEVIGDP